MRAHRKHLLSASRDDLHDIGDMHLWNQRSNHIANHAFHAVTRFDLILRDASLGSVLVSFAVNLDNLPEALDILQQLYGVEVMRLPGGIALLSRA